MKLTFYIVIVLVISVNAQTPQSPCPGIFDYEGDSGKVYGLIHVPLRGVNSVNVKVNFTIAASLYSVSVFHFFNARTT